MTKDVISMSISVLLLFRHYISHKITFGAPSSGGVLCSACGAFIIYKVNRIMGIIGSIQKSNVIKSRIQQRCYGTACMPSYKADHMVKKLGAKMTMLYPNLCYNKLCFLRKEFNF